MGITLSGKRYSMIEGKVGLTVRFEGIESDKVVCT